MADILVDFIGELEELLFVMVHNAGLADVVIRFHLRFVSFGLRFYGFLAIVTVEVEHPFIVGLTQLISNAEKSESEVMVSGKNLQFPFPFEDHLYYAVNVLGFLGFLSDFPKNNIGIDALAQHHGLAVFALIFVAHEAELIGVHEVVAMSQVHFLVSELDPDNLLH